MLKRILNNGEGRVVLGNYGALLFIQAANFILPLIVLPYLVTTLGTEKYGVVMIAQSMAIFLTVIVDFGFNISATREVSLLRDNKEKLSQLFWNVIAIKIVLATILFLLVIVLVSTLARFQNEMWVYLFSFLMVIGQAIFPTWFFQGIEKMKVITIVNVVAKILFTSAVFLIVLQAQDYEYVPLLHGGGFLIAGLFGLFYAVQHVGFSKPNSKESKKLMMQSSSLFVSNFATSMYTAGNTFILGMIGGESIAGVYASMEKLVLAFKNVYAPLYQALFPWLSKKGLLEMRDFIKKIWKPIALSALIITIGFLFFAREIVTFIYDNASITSYSVILKILSLIALFSALNMLLVSLYFPSTKEYTTRMKVLVSGGVFNLIAALIGAHFYGIYGVAIAAVSSELFILLIAFAFFKVNSRSKN